MLIMLTVITSDSNDQSDHFKTLITQWLFNHCCYIISCKKVLTLDSLLKFSFQKSLFLHVFSLHNQKLYLASQKSSWAYEFWVCCHAFLWTLQSLAKEMSCWQWNQSLHRVCMSWSQMQSHFLNDEVKKNKDRMWSHSLWAAKCSQADAKDLCKSYSSAKSICVSEKQETDDDWMKVSKHHRAWEKMRERLANHCWMIFFLTCLSSRLRFHQTLTDWVSQLKLSQKHLTVLEISSWFSSVLDMFIIFSLD